MIFAQVFDRINGLVSSGRNALWSFFGKHTIQAIPASSGSASPQSRPQSRQQWLRAHHLPELPKRRTEGRRVRELTGDIFGEELSRLPFVILGMFGQVG
jgi:hypothetical protein